MLGNKIQLTYQPVFEQVERVVDGFAPAPLLMDFEDAAFNTAAVVFPDNVVKGCFFNVCFNVYKHIQSEGLQVLY